MARTANNPPQRKGSRGGGKKWKSLRQKTGFRKSDDGRWFPRSPSPPLSPSPSPQQHPAQGAANPTNLMNVVNPAIATDRSRLDKSRYDKCAALAEEADGLADGVYRLRLKLSKKGALNKMNSVRKLVGKSLRRLVHSMSMLKCRKYHFAPTQRRLRDTLDPDGNVIPALDQEGIRIFSRNARKLDESPFDDRNDYFRGFKH